MKRLFLFAVLAFSLVLTAEPVRVGLLNIQENLGGAGIKEFLSGRPDIELKELTLLTEANLADVKVLIIPKTYSFEDRNLLRQMVAKGMGVLLTHDASGSGRVFFFRAAAGSFPELSSPRPGISDEMIDTRKMNVVNPRHPVTRGLDKEFLTQYKNHTTLVPVNESMVLIEDAPERHLMDDRAFWGVQARWARYRGGHAVLAAGSFGAGRVVLYGGLPGVDIHDRPVKVGGEEAKLLINAIEWLSGKGEAGIDMSPMRQSKYTRDDSVNLPLFDRNAVALVSAESVETPAIAKAPIPVILQLPEAGKAAMIEFPLTEEYGSPTAVVINRKMYPLELRNRDGKRYAAFVAVPEKTQLAANLIYTAAPPDITVKIKQDSSCAEIATPEMRVVVAAENGVPGIQFLNIYDWDYHHTWLGLERANYSAALLRVSKSLWPFWRKPFSMYHEQGYPEPDFSWTLKSSTRHYLYADVNVAKGSIRVYRNGQIELNGFAKEARLASWGFDYYTVDGKEYPENIAYDLPEFKGQITAVKQGRYILGGDFNLTGRLGITGISPGIHRQLVCEGPYLYANTDYKNITAYQKLPENLTAGVTVNKEDNSGMLILPERTVVFKKLLRRRHSGNFYPDKPVPLEIYRNMLPENLHIASWEVEDGKLKLQSAGNADIIAAMLQLDPGNEDQGIYHTLRLSVPEPFKIGSFQTTLYALDQQGKRVAAQPLNCHCLVTVPLGIFTFSSQWTNQRQKCPPEEWHKLIRDIAMANLDYVIHTAYDGGQTEELTPVILNRIKRFGLRWIPSLAEFQAKYVSANRDEYQAVRPAVLDPAIDREMAGYIANYKADPAILGWYLSGEAAQGADGQSVGYQIANHIYEQAAAQLPENILKYSMVSLSSTTVEAGKTFLKTDILSFNPYFDNWLKLKDAMTKIKPQQSPLWTTIRCCGPGWMDTLDLWFDIRMQTLTAWLAGSDSINYFMYAHWLSDMEQNNWYAVWPGLKGPVAAPRRQILDAIAEDIRLLTSAEYLAETRPELRGKFNEACAKGQAGRFYEMRSILQGIIQSAK